MKKIYFTFDYELSLKKSGTAQKCLLEPTYRLLDVLDRYNYKVTFFIDTMYLERLKNENEKTYSDYLKIENQLQDIVRRGHRIELHLHPHWIDAKYVADSNEWRWESYEHYRLDSFSGEEIDKMFETGLIMLNSIAGKVDSTYHVIAFRAGGWCVEPFYILRNIFERYGIRIDSSVAPRIVLSSRTHNVDYSSLDSNISFYRFNDDVKEPVLNGFFIEMPITTYPVKFWQFVLSRIYLKIFRSENKALFGDGIGLETNNHRSNFKKLCSIVFDKEYVMYTIDGFSFNRFVLRNIANDKHEKIVFISHPKLLTKHSLCFFVKASRTKLLFKTLYDYYENTV